MNRTLCDILGFEVAALLQRAVRDITHPDDWPGNDALLRRLHADDEPFSLVKRAIRGDGKVVWVQVYASMLWGVQDKPVTATLVRPVLPVQAFAAPMSGQTTPLTAGPHAALHHFPSSGDVLH